MQIMVISDLHLGVPKDGSDIFGWHATDFIATMESVIVQYNVEMVVLNGDIYELYKWDFAEVVEHNRELLAYLYSKKPVYLRGNHDIFNNFGKDHLLILNSSGQTIYIEHGHNADFLNGTRTGRMFGRWMYLLIKALCRFKWFKNLYLAAIAFDDDIQRIPRKYNSFRYLNYALNLLRKYDVVILGHTHKIEYHKTYYLNKKKRYLNCGSCSMGRFQAVILDTETLWYETVKIR